MLRYKLSEVRKILCSPPLQNLNHEINCIVDAVTILNPVGNWTGYAQSIHPPAVISGAPLT
jgi:hypothetical protein